jgi:effector-binding domain-containing protein
VEYQAPMSDMGQLMGAIFGEIMAYLITINAYPVGPPFSYYKELSPDPQGNWNVISGFPVEHDITGNDRVKPFVIPGAQQVAVAIHIGPYDTIDQSYTTIQGWLSDQHLEPSGGMWESYLTDPNKEPDPSKWRTAVYCPVM